LFGRFRGRARPFAPLRHRLRTARALALGADRGAGGGRRHRACRRGVSEPADMNGCVRAVLIIVALTAADVAVAHAPMGEGVSGGLLHPYLVPAHAMSLVALGLFIGRRREQGIPLLAFAAALIGGLVALTFAIAETPAAEILLGNTGLLGVLLAADWNPPKPF